MVWWAWISPSYADRREELTVRWIDPSGRVVAETPARKLRRPNAGATLELDSDITRRLGIWRVEALLDGEPVDRRTFRMVPAQPADPPRRSLWLEPLPRELRPAPVGNLLQIEPPVMASGTPELQLLVEQRQVEVGVGEERVRPQHRLVVVNG